MPTAVGPNTFGEENLVFGYDLGDVQNSYKGEPTTNLLPAGIAGVHDQASGNAVTVTDASSEKGAGWKKVTITARGTNFRTLQWTYISMTSNTLYCHSAVFDWGNMRGKNYFIYFDGDGTGTRAYYRPEDYINQGSGNIDSTMPDGKFAGTITHTTSHTHAFFIGNYATSVSGLNDYFYYKEFQVEVNSHPTQFTTGTRSATQGLLDFAGNSTIDLTNVSFDSNAQMTFDGSDDKIYLVTTTLSYLSSSAIEFVVTPEVIDKRMTVGGYRHNDGYSAPTIGSVYIQSDNKFYGSLITAAEVYRQVGSTTTITANRTYHVVFNKDTSAGIMQLYVNGVLESTQTFSAATYGQWPSAGSYIGSNILDFGKSNNTNAGQGWSGDFLDGKIHTFKLYSRTLTASEVRANFNAIRGRFNI